jgi:hypothetical protein
MRIKAKIKVDKSIYLARDNFTHIKINLLEFKKNVIMPITKITTIINKISPQNLKIATIGLVFLYVYSLAEAVGISKKMFHVWNFKRLSILKICGSTFFRINSIIAL